MADGPIAITVDSKITIDGLTAPVGDKVQLTVDGIVRLYVTVKPGSTDPERLCIMPGAVDQPKFLLVKPLKASARFKKADAAPSETDESKKWEWITQPIDTPVVGPANHDKEPEAGLWYSTANSEWRNDHKDQWKPLTGGHVFVCGMAEWVTDMVAREGDKPVPGPLTDLWFKNTGVFKLKRKGKDGKDEESHDAATITVLVVAGYSPKPQGTTAPDPSAAKDKTAGQPGG